MSFSFQKLEYAPFIYHILGYRVHLLSTFIPITTLEDLILYYCILGYRVHLFSLKHRIFYYILGYRVHSFPLQHRRFYLLQSPQKNRPWSSPSLCPQSHVFSSLKTFSQGKCSKTCVKRLLSIRQKMFLRHIIA